MWPWKRQPAVDPPPWTFTVAEGTSNITWSPGEWVVTDGAHLSDEGAISLGTVEQGHGTLRVERSIDRLRSLTIDYPGTQPPDSHEIVIDSGYVVICCRQAFEDSGVRNRTSGTLLREARHAEKAAPISGVVLITDGSGACVGLVAASHYGDGAYALSHTAREARTTLQIELENGG
ncbi:MAG: hypothetical protein DWQ37_13390 [Planctomycetota bacterium]|nr:MAG: hypothetical protein DWQ37_13390 [Planctomycetota bacterium]